MKYLLNYNIKVSFTLTNEEFKYINEVITDNTPDVQQAEFWHVEKSNLENKEYKVDIDLSNLDGTVLRSLDTYVKKKQDKDAVIFNVFGNLKRIHKEAMIEIINLNTNSSPKQVESHHSPLHVINGA